MNFTARSVEQVCYKALDKSFGNNFSLLQFKSIKKVTKNLSLVKRITKMQMNIVKLYYSAEKLQFPYKLCVTEERT